MAREDIEKAYCNFCKKFHRVDTDTYIRDLKRGYIKGKESEKVDKQRERTEKIAKPGYTREEI